MLDYIIVGQGVAGSCFALKLLKENKSFIVIDENKNKASSVAVGIYNPVVLKRFSLIWNAEEQLKWMLDYFSSFEKLLGEKFIHEIPTYRIFKNEDEIKTWQKKAKQPELIPFLNDEIFQSNSPEIKAPFGFAEVKQTGRIDLENCMKLFQMYLSEHDLIRNEKFDHLKIQFHENHVEYEGILAKRIVFCEGFGVKENPFFKDLPVIGVKGEVLKIKTETEIPKGIWKAYNFLLPLEDQLALTASTYDRDDLTYEPTEKGRAEIQNYLEEIYTGNYEIAKQNAGIRPTIIDRRPILGHHPKFENLWILNGMGTRGTLLGPQMTEFLYDQIEKGVELPKETDVKRFEKYWN
ncbi:NAD(P)/FAD-dependent oxidoreductase [Moheibacter lacus]|uniref:FAD-dependent oxidoreductase n=1 Tax=Moheibacter lacus TaxID=2745851 RepID=A0A838ZRP5_9FLAO|nr:FAD-dependent oxidoreductase [Moheibacter lacus]MBA5629163.1 FAD-dependent oxidoreductase [Moheibacter lacus]